MKKFLCILLFIPALLLTSCSFITDNIDEYERKQYQCEDTISEIHITDISTDITIRNSDTDTLLIEYSDSPTDSWYSIDSENGIITIEKTRGTVGVDDNTLIVSLPKNVYQNITIETTNGDIIFDNIAASTYKCSTENGDIKGTLNGNEAEYLIVTTAKNGNSNLKNNVIESSKSIELNVENGDIKIEFSE